jgi:glycosyltransferase involved in cell wall biosynthesis
LHFGDQARFINSQSPALIHAHTSKAGLLGRFAGWMTRVPVVFTAHTWSFADGISNLQRVVSLPFERIAASLGGKVIAVSEANARAALDRSVVHASRLTTIWNGMPDAPYRSQPGKGQVFNVIMVARFAPQKDQICLVRALAEVAGDWQLTLVGEGPTRPEVEFEVARLNLSGRVRFLGDRSDVPELLAASDVFVLATKWEGLPLSILEAMRAGLPVIATAVGGCAEAVTEGVTGFLTSPSDVEQLRDRLQTLFSTRSLAATMGRAGRARFENDFQVASMMDKLLRVYHELVPVTADAKQHLTSSVLPDGREQWVQ